jgi:hypothetical protein
MKPTKSIPAGASVTPGSAGRPGWAIRLLALPVQFALFVDRFVNRPSRPPEVPPAQLTYTETVERGLQRVSGGPA